MKSDDDEHCESFGDWVCHEEVNTQEEAAAS
jgi:hypothetical protein